MKPEKVLTIDEAVNLLSNKFIEVKDILDHISIKDIRYSKYFISNIENALITVAVIKAFGISGKSENYLVAVKNVVTELRTADSKG